MPDSHTSERGSKAVNYRFALHHSMAEEHDECSAIRDSMEARERMVLYAIGAMDQPIGSLVNLQKLIFIASRCRPDILGDVFYFETHKKGPYSKDIDETVYDFSSRGLVHSRSLELTERGHGVYEAIRGAIKEPLKSTLDYWKDFCHDLTEDELLTFVYYTYPDTVENSEVVEGIRKGALKNTVSLVNRDKITVGKGAEMLGMGYFEFEDVLRRRGVRWRS